MTLGSLKFLHECEVSVLQGLGRSSDSNELDRDRDLCDDTTEFKENIFNPQKKKLHLFQKLPKSTQHPNLNQLNTNLPRPIQVEPTPNLIIR